MSTENSDNRLMMVALLLMTAVTSIALTLVFAGKTTHDDAVVAGGIDKKELNAAIADFFKENPSAIVQAIASARQLEEDAQRVAGEQAIKTNYEALMNDPDTPYTGNENADVTIVSFSDYNCGFCKRVVPDLEKLLNEDKNLKIVSKDFPILGPRSSVSAKAAIALFTVAPEKWWDFHRDLLKNTPRSDDQLYAMIAKHGVDVEAVKKEMESANTKKVIDKNMALGREIGVQGTPAFVINGDFIRGAVGLDVFKERIEAARAAQNS